MKRILTAGVLGGLAMFIWASLAHVVLGLGSVGVREIPGDEPLLLKSLQATVPQEGLYLYPGWGLPPDASQSQRNAAMPEYAKKIASGPSGLLIYHPSGRQPLAPRQLVTELSNNILLAIIASVLLSFATGLRGYGARVGFVTLAGIMAGLTTNVSYWNWYGFPGNYTVAYAFTEMVGYLCIALVAAAIVKNDAPARLAAAA